MPTFFLVSKPDLFGYLTYNIPNLFIFGDDIIGNSFEFENARKCQNVYLDLARFILDFLLIHCCQQ